VLSAASGTASRKAPPVPTKRQAPDARRPMRTATVRVRDRYTREIVHEIGVTAAFAQGSNYGRFLISSHWSRLQDRFRITRS
jgi:hypothetical protein